MSSISAEMVRRLREETGAGMMECKSALVEANGDVESARQILRKKGLATAAKKASRTAADGAIGSWRSQDGRVGVLVEVNCETDFVAKTPDFQGLVRDVAEHVAAAAPQDLTALAEQPFHKDKALTVAQLVQEKIARIKENIVVRRFSRFELPAGGHGLVDSYIHPGAKVGVLVELQAGSGEQSAQPQFHALAHDVAMHVAAASPAAALYVHRSDVPAGVLEKEKEIYRAQAAATGKPANVVEKIAEGKVKEYYATFCLLEQAFIRDPKLTVSSLLKDGVAIRRFARYRLGEESGTKPAGE
ncbi:MAG TPA: translation elongation factor Ts [Vicinamibacteria bacterium]|nr:translation elongation factor Ts [Vicinamibacteria bacterium]